MVDDISALVASIEGRVKGSAPADPKEFAALIWDLLRMQILRVTEGAKNDQLYKPNATRDFEVINKLADLFHRVTGAPVSAAGGSESLSGGMNEAIKLLSKGNIKELEAFIKQQEERLKTGKVASG